MTSRAVALKLPRTEDALVRDQVKFRVGRIVYVALSRDERSMGFGFPKDERTFPVESAVPVPRDPYVHDGHADTPIRDLVAS